VSEETLYVMPALAGDEMAVTNAQTVEPLANPPLASFMLTCPRTWQGDTGMQEWCTALYNQGNGSVAQTAPPTLSSISPKHVRANTNASVNLTGTAFDPTTVKALVIATQLTPSGTPATTATFLNVVITASLIPTSGSFVQVSVVNGSGALSNALNLYLD